LAGADFQQLDGDKSGISAQRLAASEVWRPRNPLLFKYPATVLNALRHQRFGGATLKTLTTQALPTGFAR